MRLNCEETERSVAFYHYNNFITNFSFFYFLWMYIFYCYYPSPVSGQGDVFLSLNMSYGRQQTNIV